MSSNGVAVAVGDWVQHEHHGIGVVLFVSGTSARAQAEINFAGNILWILLRGAPMVRLLHDCAGGLVAYSSPLMGPCVRHCLMCAPVCVKCAGAGCFPPDWLGNPVEVAESIVWHTFKGFSIELCPACGGVVGMERVS